MGNKFYEIKNFISNILQTVQDAIHSVIYKWDPFVVSIVIYVVMALIVAGFIYIWFYLYKNEQLAKKYKALSNSTNDYITKSMVNSKVKGFNYGVIQQYIKSSGLAFMFGPKFTPIKYILFKLLSAAFGFIVGVQINIFVGFAIMIAAYFLLDFIARESNELDNKKMLDDIKGIYDTIGMQSRAGRYVKDTIVDCYLGVKNARLKQAMLELTSEIIAKSDIQNSVEEFRSKFNNQYIDALAVVIKQSFESGSMSNMMMDIRKQIEDIEQAIAEAEKINIRREISVVQIMLYTAILAVALYVGITALSNGLGM